jgi:hypothetical protein
MKDHGAGHAVWAAVMRDDGLDRFERASDHGCVSRVVFYHERMSLHSSLSGLFFMLAFAPCTPACTQLVSALPAVVAAVTDAAQIIDAIEDFSRNTSGSTIWTSLRTEDESQIH